MDEEYLVKEFEECYQNEEKGKIIEIGTGNQSKMADCELEYNKEYVKLEAKVFKDTRSNSNNIHKMFTQILTNRKKVAFKNINNLNVSYGFLFDKRYIEYVKNKLKKEFIESDLLVFEECFELKYVFIYDSEKKSFEVEEWKDFIEVK